VALDLQALFGFSVSPLELVLRGSVMYWLLFLLFRFVLRRDVGAIGIADVLLLVLIAGWNYLMDWGSFHVPMVRKLVEPPPLLLVKNGRLQRRNMRHELITTEELWGKLRMQGVRDLAQVQSAFIESDGEISVLKTGTSGDEAAPARKLP
jgi:uncharacterized membrane protein YcaP (DUF421 family)